MSFNPTGGASGSRLTVPPAYPRASGFEDLEGLMFTEADCERELLEGLEGTSVQVRIAAAPTPALRLHGAKCGARVPSLGKRPGCSTCPPCPAAPAHLAWPHTIHHAHLFSPPSGHAHNRRSWSTLTFSTASTTTLMRPTWRCSESALRGQVPTERARPWRGAGVRGMQQAGCGARGGAP